MEKKIREILEKINQKRDRKIQFDWWKNKCGRVWKVNCALFINPSNELEVTEVIFRSNNLKSVYQYLITF